jgi:hypothetical protein
MGCGCGKSKEEKAAEMQARLDRRAAARAARKQEVAARADKPKIAVK